MRCYLGRKLGIQRAQSPHIHHDPETWTSGDKKSQGVWLHLGHNNCQVVKTIKITIVKIIMSVLQELIKSLQIKDLLVSDLTFNSIFTVVEWQH